MPDATTIEIEQTLSSQFKGLDRASKESTAELWKRHDLTDIVQQVLEEKGMSVVYLKQYRILRSISSVLWRHLPVGKATEVIVDTIGKCVAKSAQDVSSAASDPHEKPTGGEEMDSPRRLDVAALLDLPSLKDAVRAVAEHQRISSDPANRLPEKITLDGQGGFSLEIPRHQY
jgi:hypothetical protein